MKLRYLIYLLLILGLGYLIYHRISTNKALTGGNRPGGSGMGGNQPALVVDGVIVRTADFDNQLDLTGSIEANEAVALKSEVSGLVTGIYFKEGAHVNKGDLLVRINDREINAQLQDIITKENLAATNENRAKQLLDRGAISQAEYDAALADLKSLSAQVQLIRAQLAKTSILAPFSGQIGLRSISVGEYLTPTTSIANLLSINPVKINFSVPEKYASQVRVNAPVTFHTDGASRAFTGTVFAVEPGIDQQTRTLQIKALAPNPSRELLPGAFAKVKLSLTTIQNAMLIPTEAVIPVLNGKMVYISKEGKAQQVAVEAGTRTADQIVITSGLNPGDTVLTTGAMALKPGAPVKVNIVDKK